MCEKTKAVLDILETRKKPLTKGEIMTVFKKVVEDSEKMGVRMTNIEKRMSSLEEKTDNGFKSMTEQFEKIKSLIEEKHRTPTLLETVVALKDHKMFWIFLIVVLLIVGSLLGVKTSGFNGILNIGG
jgi:superfamily II RNA helicase